MEKNIFHTGLLKAKKKVQKRMPARVARVSSVHMEMRTVRVHGSINVPGMAERRRRSGNKARNTRMRTKENPMMPSAAMMPRY